MACDVRSPEFWSAWILLYLPDANTQNALMLNVKRFPSVVLFFSSMLWGMSWIPLKALSDLNIGGLAIICVAYSALFIVTLPFVLRFRDIYGKHGLSLAAIFLVGGLANACFNYALIHGQVLRVMALFYLLPVWGVLGGRFILKEPTNGLRWLGVVLAVVGAAILLDIRHALENPVSWVDVIALSSGVFFSALILLFRAVDRVPLEVKLNSLFLGCAFVAAIAMILWVPEEIDTVFQSRIYWVVIFAIGWLVWANIGSQWACTKLPAGRSAIIMVMELVAAAVTAVCIGGERFTLGLLVGGSLILTATFIEIIQAIQEGGKTNEGPHGITLSESFKRI